MPRRYEMAGRSAAMERTREQILDAAEGFADVWYDELTIADVAREAGVSAQTVVNHFGSKMHLFLTAIQERFAPAISEVRSTAEVGDVSSIVAAVVADYEVSGDRTFRLVALAAREDELRPLVAMGRRAHQEFVERSFQPLLARRGSAARERQVRLLAAVLDVSVWRVLRRSDGLDPEATREHLAHLVRGVLAQ